VILYPLKFTPRLVEKIWGGRKLETVLGKQLPAGKQIGESWELYDFPPGVVENSADWVSSVIAEGPLKGQSLHGAVQEFGSDLLGGVRPVGPHGQFPLLIKFLDAREDLSVQVHPDEAYARAHPAAHLKTEAWYVLESDADSRLFKGLQPGTTKERFRQAITQGKVEQHLGVIPGRKGDCHYLPSGTIHALGAGILVAEVQTPSDTTFRVYDFNRIDATTGKPRALHVDQAMECIHFGAPPECNASPRSDGTLVTSPFFQIGRRTTSAASEHPLSEGKPLILILLNGTARIDSRSSTQSVSLSRGETVLLPASLRKTSLLASADCEWLEVHIPPTI
jgi:mannose-6-phosphate isomerase